MPVPAHIRRLAPRAGGLAIAAALAAGCSGGAQDRASSTTRGPATTPPGAGSSRAAAIRGWIAALNAGDHGAAASYFAPGAIVQQRTVFRLRDRAAAVAFNRSLPCRARVARVRDGGAGTVAVFDLRPGPGGARGCGGSTRVRFCFERGRFTEWRQLPDLRRPPGTAA